MKLAAVEEQSGQPERAPQPVYGFVEGEPLREYYTFVPDSIDPAAVPLVVVHGISRNAIEHLVRFAPLARRLGVPLIAPLFSEHAYPAYQQVIDAKRGIRADTALFDIFAEFARRGGAVPDRFDVFGFSGGSQFAHRMALLYPERIRNCVCAAAGWYTWPDFDEDFPKGLASHPLAGGSYDFDAIANVPFHLIVGRRDTERDPALRKGRRIDAQQGSNRLERAHRWRRAMEETGVNRKVTLTELRRTGHNFDRAQQRGLCQIVFERLGYEFDHAN